MDRPQLILHRKFCPVIWGRKRPILVSIIGDGKQLKLECKASGFPTPSYQWMEEDKAIENATSSSLIILRCSCTARNVFRCKIYNEINEGEIWSDFYRTANKIYTSELISDVIDLTNFLSDSQFGCELCTQTKVAEIYKKVNSIELSSEPQNSMMTTSK